MVQCRSLAEVVALRQQLREHPLQGQRDLVAAARTLLIDFRSRRNASAAMRQIRRLKPKPAEPEEPREIEVPVHYDGEDLGELAEELSLSTERLIAWHTSTTWVAVFGGNAPGFTYCVPEELLRRRKPRRSETLPAVPRLNSLREVTAGAVALAGEFSAVYPRCRAGSWRVIGVTDAPLWSPDHTDPALLHAGDRVRYTYRAERIEVQQVPRSPHRNPAPGKAALRILDPGVQTLVQDAGRRGFSDIGVIRSGSADAAAARQANQLVGNEDHAAVFEVLFGKLEIAALQTLVVAVAGADAVLEVFSPVEEDTSNMALNGTGAAHRATPRPDQLRQVPARAPFWMSPGERLRIHAPTRGLYSYLAVSGGVEAAQALGSSATDTLSGVGPAPLSAGDEFALVGATSRFVGIADVARTPLPSQDGPTVLRCVTGPRSDCFATHRHQEAGMDHLQSITWEVSSDSNRVGLRLTNEQGAQALAALRTEEEIVPEPLLSGAVQIPDSGEPVLLLTDHPVTGGYPVLAVVVREDLGLAAQLPPGTHVRLVRVDPDTLTPL